MHACISSLKKKSFFSFPKIVSSQSFFRLANNKLKTVIFQSYVVSSKPFINTNIKLILLSQNILPSENEDVKRTTLRELKVLRMLKQEKHC